MAGPRVSAPLILFTADVPLPAVADLGVITIRYNLSRVNALEENAILIQGDHWRRVRAVGRTVQAAQANHRTAWPKERQTHESDGYEDAMDALMRLLAQANIDVRALNRAWHLRVIADCVVGVWGLEDAPDPQDPTTWDAWGDDTVAWVAEAGVVAAKEQMTGPKAKNGSGTTTTSAPIPGPEAPSAPSSSASADSSSTPP